VSLRVQYRTATEGNRNGGLGARVGIRFLSGGKLMHSIHRISMLVLPPLAAVALQACAGPAIAQGAPAPTPAPTLCTGTAATDTVRTLTIESCLSTNVADTGIQGNLGSYYGWVALDTGGAFTVQKKNPFLKALLGALTGFSEKKTTIVSVVISRSVAGIDTVVFERPLAEITRVSGGSDEIKVSTLATADTRVTPFFVPDAGSTDLKARIKLSVVETYKSDDLVKAREGVDPGTPITGSVVSGIGELPYAVIVNRLYIGLLSALSTSADYSKEVAMSFDGAGGYKTASFRIALDATSNIRFSLKLKGRKSLVTTEKTAAGLLDFSGLSDSRFADQIHLLDPNTKLPVTLSAYLDANNVPRRLTELSTGTTAARTDKEAVDLACQDLRKALFSSPIKLGLSDARAVLFNEMKTRNLLDRFDAREMTCTADQVTRWKTEFAGLTVPEPAQPVPMTVSDKNRRLDLIATAWAQPDQNARTAQFANSISGNSINVVAPAELFPNALINPGADGRITQPLSAPGLALRQKRCFGNYKPSSPETLPEATAFAQFEGFEPSYLVKIQFEDRQNFDPGFGPRVKALDIKAADANDKALYNQKSAGEKCF